MINNLYVFTYGDRTEDEERCCRGVVVVLAPDEDEARAKAICSNRMMAKAIAEGWYQTTVFNPSNTTGTVYSDHDSW